MLPSLFCFLINMRRRIYTNDVSIRHHSNPEQLLSILYYTEYNIPISTFI